MWRWRYVSAVKRSERQCHTERRAKSPTSINLHVERRALAFHCQYEMHMLRLVYTVHHALHAHCTLHTLCTRNFVQQFRLCVLVLCSEMDAWRWWNATFIRLWTEISTLSYGICCPSFSFISIWKLLERKAAYASGAQTLTHTDTSCESVRCHMQWQNHSYLLLHSLCARGQYALTLVFKRSAMTVPKLFMKCSFPKFQTKAFLASSTAFVGVDFGVMNFFISALRCQSRKIEIYLQFVGSNIIFDNTSDHLDAMKQWNVCQQEHHRELNIIAFCERKMTFWERWTRWEATAMALPTYHSHQPEYDLRSNNISNAIIYELMNYIFDRHIERCKILHGKANEIGFEFWTRNFLPCSGGLVSESSK